MRVECSMCSRCTTAGQPVVAQSSLLISTGKEPRWGPASRPTAPTLCTLYNGLTAVTATQDTRRWHAKAYPFSLLLSFKPNDGRIRSSISFEPSGRTLSTYLKLSFWTLEEWEDRERGEYFGIRNYI